MNVEVFSFCEYAANNNGSLTLQGTFDHQVVTEFPAVIPDFYMVVRVRLPRENPTSDCQLLFIDPDGKLAFKPTELKLQGPVTNTILRNRNVKVGKIGTYHVVLRANEKVVASIPLFIQKSTSRNVSPAGCLN
ncbi:MAG: hypothetical protein P1U89_22355 [Verrucomicrobiales bacterium]|nr:hypothetical protein [Verrucomicrobiales bacterium]